VEDLQNTNDVVSPSHQKKFAVSWALEDDHKNPSTASIIILDRIIAPVDKAKFQTRSILIIFDRAER